MTHFGCPAGGWAMSDNLPPPSAMGIKLTVASQCSYRAVFDFPWNGCGWWVGVGSASIGFPAEGIPEIWLPLMVTFACCPLPTPHFVIQPFLLPPLFPVTSLPKWSSFSSHGDLGVESVCLLSFNFLSNKLLWLNSRPCFPSGLSCFHLTAHCRCKTEIKRWTKHRNSTKNKTLHYGFCFLCLPLSF